jgi:acyl-CoA reductase-like NAD-dependent aldehyde dehydrogenase
VVRSSAENFAKLSLELGGKSPNIIFADADLDSAVNGAIAGIYAASGQSCVAGSRLLVQAEIYEEFIQRLTARAQRIKIGNPQHDDSEMGPMATAQQLAVVEGLVADALAEGATLRMGGKRPQLDEQGWFYEPTLFECNSNSMKIMQEEVFGPVAAIIPFKDEADALAMANDSQFGLAAGIWTRDLGRAHRMAKAVRSGIIWVNTYRAVSAMAPIGGFKNSGYGRESGLDSVLAYTELKTVWINLSSAPMPDPFVMR